MKPRTMPRVVISLLSCPILLVSWLSLAQVNTNWTIGPKKVLCIRINYPDDVTEPIREADVYPLMAGANQVYAENSYGATSLANVTVTPVVLMPQPKAYYNPIFRVTDAWDVAARAGFYRTNYDVDCIFSVNLGFNDGYNPYTRSLFIVNPSVPTICRMLGHAYSLPNVGLWMALGDTVIGPGERRSYGSPFDAMSGGVGGDFNACQRNQLGWLQQPYIQDVVSNGLFRLYAVDVPQLTNGFKYALRINRGDQTDPISRYYWVELRQKLTNNPSTQNGPLLYWGAEGSTDVTLLDTTPAYASGNADALFVDGALRPCQTFSDTEADIHITPLTKNGTIPESIDVRVNLGSFTNNQPPTIVLTPGPTNVSAGDPVSFAAKASDPDGDELAYAWDFGDGGFALNQTSVTHSWTTAGKYVVRCAVTDMKGGTGSAAILVQVGSPATFAISGHVKSGGQPVEGVRMATSLTTSALTSSDGSYTLTGLGNGHYILLPEKARCLFSPTCLNVVVSNQNVTDMDFNAETDATPNKAPLVQFKSPQDGWTLMAGTSLDVSADVFDDGTVSDVEFYDGTTFLGSGRDGITWDNVPAGEHILRAVATDDLGLSANSADAAITVVTGRPPNDDFSNRIQLSGAPVSVVGYNIGATAEPGEPGNGITAATHSIWYSWVAPSNGLFAVSTDDGSSGGPVTAIYTGSALTNLVFLNFGVKGNPAVFLAEQGLAYQIVVDSIWGPGTIMLDIHPAHPPVNDNFADRITIGGCPVTITGCNVDATTEVGEPYYHGYDHGGASIWWSWRAPENGTVTISSAGSGFRTLMAVYTGTSLENLAFVAGRGWGEQSFKAVGGTTYQIAVDAGQRGQITLAIRRANSPPNDDFANRIVLTGGAAVAYGSNSDATREPDEPRILGGYGGASVWWSWTAPFDARLVVNANFTGTGLLGVYTGNALDDLSVVASQYIDGRITFQAVAGTTYQIAVDTFGDDRGAIRLQVFPETPRFEWVRTWPNAGLQMALAAEPSRAYVVEASGDLINWMPIQKNWSFTGSTLFTNSDFTQFQRRFYRAVSQ